METQTIRYNLRDRMRKHRGQPRNFNIPRLVKVINGGAVQERVRMRDMHGYLEHTPRIRFGMNPGACQIEGGKMITIEPAIVTTYLKAYDDGTVEHRAEFLDTPPGQVAARMMKSKVGGFSSAIDESRPEFYGFDYVSEPNFALNRTYAVALDSVSGAKATLDDVNEYNAHVSGILKLLDSVTTAHSAEIQTLRATLDQTLAVVDRLTLENREFLAICANQGRVDAGQGVALDGVFLEDMRPFTVESSAADRLKAAIGTFGGAALAGYEPLQQPGDPKSRALGASLDAVMSRMGVPR